MSRLFDIVYYENHVVFSVPATSMHKCLRSTSIVKILFFINNLRKILSVVRCHVLFDPEVEHFPQIANPIGMPESSIAGCWDEWLLAWEYRTPGVSLDNKLRPDEAIELRSSLPACEFRIAASTLLPIFPKAASIKFDGTRT